MTNAALQEHVHAEQAAVRLFHHVDNLGADSRRVHVEVQTYGGSAFLVQAGGPPPRRWDGEQPPFTAYQVEFAQDRPIPWLPKVWQRYTTPEDGMYMFVPKLLIAHLVFVDGGLLSATFEMIRS